MLKAAKSGTLSGFDDLMIRDATRTVEGLLDAFCLTSWSGIPSRRADVRRNVSAY